MSKYEIELCSHITKEYFGDVVAKVANFLASNGSSSFRTIACKSKFSDGMVKKCLWVLMQHNIVTFTLDPVGQVKYSASLTNIQARTRFFKYISRTKALFCDGAELIIKELARQGQMEMNEVIETVSEQLLNSPAHSYQVKKTLHEKFVQLAKTNFIVRCPMLDATSVIRPGVPSFKSSDSHLFDVPGLDAGKRKRVIEDDDEEGPAAKKSRTDSGCQAKSENTIYWRLNIDKFNEYVRDEMIVDAISRRVDQRAAEIVRAILRLSEVKTPANSPKTAAISYHEIFQALPKDKNNVAIFTKQILDQLLKILTDVAPSFIIREGDSGGGMYSIHYQRAFTELCQAHVNSIVNERFGSLSLRIFRLVTLKKQVEQKQIEELAMIKPKDAKELVYRLLDEQFLTITEVPKTPDHAPIKTIYLFSVNWSTITRILLERSYKTMSNLIDRRWHEAQINKRVVDKQRRMEAILAQIEDPEQRQEFEEQMTPAEKAQVTNFTRISDMLEQAELQLVETIFVLETYIYYSTLK